MMLRKITEGETPTHLAYYQYSSTGEVMPVLIVMLLVNGHGCPIILTPEEYAAVLALCPIGQDGSGRVFLIET